MPKGQALEPRAISFGTPWRRSSSTLIRIWLLCKIFSDTVGSQPPRGTAGSPISRSRETITERWNWSCRKPLRGNGMEASMDRRFPLGGSAPEPPGFIALGTQEGQERRKAGSRDPAPPSSTRLGARVAPQRCPILRAGNRYSTRQTQNEVTLNASHQCGLAALMGKQADRQDQQ